ncbi:formylglycine-generating enzyme family protein [Christiangramia aquimixticola]|uniref:formylglycine-generating enzyme family protein n=1 Tax=Christiangramia aquimixticola TaxID=1697558 RepID=UPI003AA8EBF7
MTFKTFSIIILLLCITVFLACKEERGIGREAILTEQVEVPDYHQAYIKEISYIKTRPDSASTDGMVKMKGGTYMMGGNDSLARPNEFPRHKEKVKDLWVDKTEVTNAQFREFVEATGYVTTAERSFEIKGKKYQPGALVFDPYNPEWWWKFTKGANWKHPQGSESNIDGKDDHPVVQVSWYDAMAYAKWAGKRLPTEAEYEYFNRAGNDTLVYNWGNELDLASPRANYFQGDFPHNNLNLDGHQKTAPVKSFPPNKFGLFETSGNVWEWCLDTYHADAYSNLENRIDGYFKEYDNMQQEKVIRGGSFLCSNSYCTGYRNAARMSSVPDTGLEHTGFRCVKDL